MYSIKCNPLICSVLFIIGSCTYSVFAQQTDNLIKQKKPKTSSWNDRKKILSIGLGTPVLPSQYFSMDAEPPKGHQYSRYSESPVIHAKAEFAVLSHLGCAITFNKSRVTFTDNYQSTNSKKQKVRVEEKIVTRITTVNFRLNYHFLNGKTLDPYIGAGAGIRITSTGDPGSRNSIGESKFDLASEISFGLRAILPYGIGFYLELGPTRSIVQGGLAFDIGRRTSSSEISD